ncbi:MAG: DUF5995 family protein [Pseudonocardiaceae bacterium]
MSSQDDLPIGSAYQTIEDVIEGFARLEQAFLARRDRRGVFVVAYLKITQELQRRIDANQFHNSHWVADYGVAFANRYHQALAAYEREDRASVPEPWRISLDTSKAGSGLVMQDLMLGINAHINHDLAFALHEVGIDPDRNARYEDHTAVNAALRVATEEVQDRIAAMYATGLGVLDQLLGNLDEEFSLFSFQAAREHAWNMGAARVNARTELEQRLLTKTIENQSVLVSGLILTPNTPFPWLIEALRAVEQIRPWWNHLGATPQAVELAAAPVVVPKPNVPTERSSVAAPPSSLDEVIERLGTLVAEFDRERNRLSIYATVYRRITQSVKATVVAGGFQDPEWMTQVDLLFAERYFRILELYAAGQVDQLPKCWAFALESMHTGRTMITQDIVLQVAPRVVHDLPIVLREAGLDQNLDKRFHDYEKTYELFTAELDDIQRMIARKYSRLVTFMDVLGGRLDEIASDVLYTRARQEAWADGLALHNEPSRERREHLVGKLNDKAIHAINKALFWNVPPVRWMCKAVRELEDATGGSWSELVEKDA